MMDIFVLMDLMMSDADDDDRLSAIICFCIALIMDKTVWLC